MLGANRFKLPLSVLTLMSTLIACGGGGGGETTSVGFTAGVFSGATNYQLRSSSSNGSGLCEQGLNRLYREDPLGYTIEATGTVNGVTSYTVTKLGKGFRSGEVISTDTTLSYDDELVSVPLPDADGVTCSGTNSYELTVLDTTTIDANQVLRFSCVDGEVTTDCVFDQSANLLRQ